MAAAFRGKRIFNIASKSSPVDKTLGKKLIDCTLLASSNRLEIANDNK